jgi:hypothetical protein
VKERIVQGGKDPARSEDLNVRFTPAEVRQLAKEACQQDRSLSGLVHWIVKRYQRGELVPKTGTGGRSS